MDAEEKEEEEESDSDVEDVVGEEADMEGDGGTEEEAAAGGV